MQSLDQQEFNSYCVNYARELLVASTSLSGEDLEFKVREVSSAAMGPAVEGEETMVYQVRNMALDFIINKLQKETKEAGTVVDEGSHEEVTTVEETIPFSPTLEQFDTVVGHIQGKFPDMSLEQAQSFTSMALNAMIGGDRGSTPEILEVVELLGVSK